MMMARRITSFAEAGRFRLIEPPPRGSWLPKVHFGAGVPGSGPMWRWGPGVPAVSVSSSACGVSIQKKLLAYWCCSDKLIFFYYTRNRCSKPPPPPFFLKGSPLFH